MKCELSIYGCVVDQEIEQFSDEDISPKAFKAQVSELKSGDELVLSINSPGGSVTGGIAIANQIKALSRSGVKTVAKIDGIAASIASVITCACDEVVLPRSSFLMIHNCWSMVQGNSNDLRKEADVMDKLNEAIISFYLDKFNKTRDELKQMMDDETWFSGSEAVDMGFKCSVVEDENEYKVAAKITDFKHVPERLMKMTNEKVNVEEEEEQKKVEVPEEEQKPSEEVPEEVKKEEAPAEETPTEEEKKEEEQEAPVVEDEQKEDVPVEDECGEPEKKDEEEEEQPTITKTECEKRVSGMQSTMAKKMDALKADHFKAIEDFKNQLKAKDEELTSVKNEVTSLKSSLDKSSEELKQANDKLALATSSLQEKMNALEMLNSGVNTPKDNAQKDWRSLRGDEFFAWLKNYQSANKQNIKR